MKNASLKQDPRRATRRRPIAESASGRPTHSDVRRCEAGSDAGGLNDPPRFEVEARVEGRSQRKRREREETLRAAQPEPLTPGITKTMVREHAHLLHRQKLLDHWPLTIEDWILAEKDLTEESQKNLS